MPWEWESAPSPATSLNMIYEVDYNAGDRQLLTDTKIWGYSLKKPLKVIPWKHSSSRAALSAPSPHVLSCYQPTFMNRLEKSTPPLPQSHTFTTPTSHSYFPCGFFSHTAILYLLFLSADTVSPLSVRFSELTSTIQKCLLASQEVAHPITFA